MSKRVINPEVRLTTQDYPDIMRREFSLAFTFEIHEAHNMNEFLHLNYIDVLASLEKKLNLAIREWARDER